MNRQYVNTKSGEAIDVTCRPGMAYEQMKAHIEAEQKALDPYLNSSESNCATMLAEAFNYFNELEMTHPHDKKEFIEGIHKCQGIIAHRILRRKYPDDFPSCKEGGGCE